MKESIGLITIILLLIGHIPYMIDTYRQKTRPHVFTWVIWSLSGIIVFLGQWIKGAGAGSWGTGMSSLIALIITILAFRNGTKNITKSDKIFFAASLIAIIPWYLSKDPTLTIVIAVLIDASAFYPTIRKTIKDPTSETFSTFALNILRHGLSLLAIANYNLATLLFPSYLLIANSFITLVMLKHKLLNKVGKTN